MTLLNRSSALSTGLPASYNGSRPRGQINLKELLVRFFKTSHLAALASRGLCCAVLASSACYFAQPFSLRSFGDELNSTRFVKTAVEQSRASKAGKAKPLAERGQRMDGTRRLLKEKDELKGRLFDVIPYPSF